MSFAKKSALVLFLSLCFLSSAARSEDANFLLLRVILGNIVLSEGISGEMRDGEVYVDLSELSEVLEEAPRSGMASLSELENIFPARFEADILLQELHIIGRGELGIEQRLIAEVSARLNRPSAPRKLIPETDKWFSTPFIEVNHRILRAYSGEYTNTDTLRFFGAFMHGDSSFSISEKDGEFSSAYGTWRRKEWHVETSFSRKNIPHFVAINRRFTSEYGDMNVELSHHGTNKFAGSFNATSKNVAVGLHWGKQKTWQLGLNGQLLSINWNATHLDYMNNEVLRSNSRVGFSAARASGYYALSKYHKTVDSHKGQLRYIMPLSDNFSSELSGGVTRHNTTEQEAKAGFVYRHNSGDGTNYRFRLSHERRFSFYDTYRTNLGLEVSKSNNTFSARASYLDNDSYQADLSVRRAMFSNRMMIDAGLSFTRDGINSAFANMSYILARDPKNNRWYVHNKFRHGALSACTINSKGYRTEAGGPYRLTNGTVMDDNGCAFIPYTGGEIALDDSQIPPWIYLREQEKRYARPRAGAVVHADFAVLRSGEIEGVLRRGVMQLYGMAVLLIPAEADDTDFPFGACAGEMQTGKPPQSDSEKDTREVRSVFDGHFYFEGVEVGEYIVAADNKWRRVRVTEGENCVADLNEPS